MSNWFKNFPQQLWFTSALCLVNLLSHSLPLRAEQTRFFELSGFNRFLEGNPKSTAISEDGALSLAPNIKEIYKDAAASYSAATAFGEDVALARIEDNQVILINKDGKEKTLYQADKDVLITSLLQIDDALLVAVSSKGRLYRLDRQGKATLYHTVNAEYIWDMTKDNAGNLYLATGAPASVIKIPKGEKPQTLFTAEQKHLRSLAYHPKLGLFVGGGERGIIYRSTNQKDFLALFDTNFTEITGLLVEPPYVYAAAVTGADELLEADAEMNPSGPYGSSGDDDDENSSAINTPLQGTLASAGSKNATQGANPATPPAALADNPEASAAASNIRRKLSRSKFTNRNIRSELLRITMDGTTEMLAGSNDEVIFALGSTAQKNLLVATGINGREELHGRLYQLDPTKKQISLLYQSPSRRLTHLITRPEADYPLATIGAGGGRLAYIGAKLAKTGEFITPVFDAGVNSRLGILQIFGEFNGQPDKTTALDLGEVKAFIRSGQTATPDNSWSKWSKALKAPLASSHDTVPNARYAQVRLLLKKGGEDLRGPEVRRLRLAYLRQNLPPFIQEIVALKKGIALNALPPEENKLKNLSLLDPKMLENLRQDKTEKPKAANSTALLLQAKPSYERGSLTIKWTADDPNGDALSYTLYYRQALGKNAKGAKPPWQLLKSDLAVPFYTLQSTNFADGYYNFRVIASDRPSNPAEYALEESKESADILIDNTPPVFSALKVNVKNQNVEITGKISDNLSPLIEATYALDGQASTPLSVDDGVLDGLNESFKLTFKNLPKGPHTLTLQAIDEADNEGFSYLNFLVE